MQDMTTAGVSSCPRSRFLLGPPASPYDWAIYDVLSFHQQHHLGNTKRIVRDAMSQKLSNGHSHSSSSADTRDSTTSQINGNTKTRQRRNPGTSAQGGEAAHQNGAETMQRQAPRTKDRDGFELDELEGGNGHAGPNGPSIASLDYSDGWAGGESTSILEKQQQQMRDKEEHPSSTVGGLSRRDKHAMYLLVALYLLQGIPLGLAMGSVPYLLRSKLSYSQIGIFTLCTYPYSLKLLWSPVVDSIYFKGLGRRKSWIVPVQTIVGSMLFWMSGRIDKYMDMVGWLCRETQIR